jgi:hypothetical protein
MAAATALVLSITGATSAAAAEEEVRRRAVGSDKPFVVSWVDGTDGTSRRDEKLADQIRAQFANAHYVVTNQGLVLGQMNGTELKPFVPRLS